jgi:2',3'-cyclic-nucleotide 2'-phosphodiesterase / 3'-nucleotidase / 5'-nucleotidase
MHLFSAILLVLQAAPKPPAPAQLPDTAHLVIVSTTDVHGRVLGWDYVRDAGAPGGLSRAATALDILRERYGNSLILVDAGDLLQGNPFATFFGRYDKRQPQPIVEALNALRYDVATPGNHDFDFGVDFLRRAAAEATYRYVSANVVNDSDKALFAPTVVVTRGVLKVGVTGFTTPGTMLWDKAQLGKMRVRRIADAAPAALAALDRDGVDLKLVLIHSGFGESSYDTSGVGPENDAASLARMNPKPDLVIVGHTHREIRDTVINGVHFVQPKNWVQSLSVVHVSLAKDSTRAGRYRVTAVRAELIPLGVVAESQRFLQRVSAAHEAARLWAGTPVGNAGPGFDARLARAQDTPLLDFINEVQSRRAGTQLSDAAVFDVQPGLPEGEVHQRDVVGIYPYENTLRAVKISGAQLREFLEHSARYFRSFEPGQPIINDSVAGYNYDVVSGVVYNIDLSRPAGQRIRGLAYNGKIVQPTDTFTMAVNSYRQVGGGGYTMIAHAPVTYDKGEDIRELLVAEIQRARTIQATVYFHPSWAIIPDAARAAARASFGAGAPVATVPTRDSTLLRVLTITDLHGQLESRVWDWSQGRPVGGVAALKPWLDSIAHACGCASLRLDGGDEMQGTALSNATFGRGTIDAMNRLGIDAAAIGNHEFDWSVDTLRARIGEAKYPFLSANITNSAGTARPDWATPWKLVTKNGVKIAVIGVTTTETPTATAPRNVQGLAFGDEAQAIKRYLPDARAGADFVIVVAHAGATCDSSASGGNTAGASCHGEIIDLARQLDSGSVDLIVAGHTHLRVNTVVHGIPIIEAQSSARSIGVVDFVRTGGRREVRTQVVTPYADQVKPDTGLTAALVRQQQAVRNVTERVVTRLKTPLKRDGDEYGLGRLIADAQRAAGRSDVAIMNNGGIRTDLPEGTLTYGQAYQVQPFQNRLLRLTVKGDVLLDALEHCVAGRDHLPDCHVSGVEVWFDATKPVGQRISRTRLADGKSIDKSGSYTLVVSDFMATGGSGFKMLSAAPKEDLDMLDVDAFVRYLGVLRAPVEAPDDVRFHRTDR